MCRVTRQLLAVPLSEAGELPAVLVRSYGPADATEKRRGPVMRKDGGDLVLSEGRARATAAVLSFPVSPCEDKGDGNGMVLSGVRTTRLQLHRLCQMEGKVGSLVYFSSLPRVTLNLFFPADLHLQSSILPVCILIYSFSVRFLLDFSCKAGRRSSIPSGLQSEQRSPLHW